MTTLPATPTTALAVRREAAVALRPDAVDATVPPAKPRFSVAGVTFTVTGVALTALGTVGIVAGWNGLWF